MGATAAYHLLRRYDALEGQTFVILGSGAEATVLAEALRSAGRTVAAIVEAASEPIDSAGCARLAASGVKIFAGAMVRRALGRDSVEGASIVRLDDAQNEVTIACDTIVLATGAAPVIELFDIAGAAIVFRSESGGHVPLVDADGRTTEPMLFGAGDCLGIKDDHPDAAAAEGVRAARAAAAALAAGSDADWPKPLIEARPAEQASSPRSSGPGRRARSQRPIRISASARRFRSPTFSASGRRVTSVATSPRSRRATSPRSPMRGGSIRIRSSV